LSDEERLNRLRNKIDKLDEQIQQLINERARCAQEIAKTKLESENSEFYRPEREAEILRLVVERNQGPLNNEEIARLFREIMSACLALESPLKIAFLGPEGTFTQEAALKHFGHSVETVALDAIDEVFREVESGTTNFGVVPIENSTEGVVNHTLDMFMASPLKICGEVELRVHHHLMGRTDDLAAIKQVVSHQQSLAQCREWLDSNLPKAERIAVGSNAEAARTVTDRPKAVAIASDSAARLYDLKILVSNIEDHPDNTTRFLIIGKLETEPSGRDKTSLLLSSGNKPGALFHLLEPLAGNKVNLTRIESRPSRQALWEYVFFLDLEGHIRDDNVRAAINGLEQDTAFIKILGSYPKAEL